MGAWLGESHRAQLCPQPSCTAAKPPALLPRHLRGTEPCPACVQEMEKPSRCSAPTAAGKLLAGVEMLSPPAQRLCRAGAQPALPRPGAHTALKGRRGTGGAPGHAELTRAHAELRRQQQSRVTVIPPTGPDASMVPPCHSDGDLRNQDRSQGWTGLVCSAGQSIFWERRAGCQPHRGELAVGAQPGPGRSGLAEPPLPVGSR